jgi:hypothetical protein
MNVIVFNHLRELDVSFGTVSARLTEVLGFSLRHTRSIPHFLTDEFQVGMVATSMKMFKVLEQQKRTHLARIIMGDES